jgi:hydroxymethylbilane synthase
MPPQTLRIATRKSPLALWQAEEVARRLVVTHPGVRCDLVKLTTEGDRFLDRPLSEAGGKGLFVKELERALLDGEADIAVHSMKDVPADLPSGLQISVLLARDDPRDAFVSNQYPSLQDLPHNARVGTSSLRRRCQLMALRPDLKISDLRGNVNTRLKRLDEGKFDALILASAGLARLGCSDRIRTRLDPQDMLPAIGQGAIGIECRKGDEAVETTIAALHDETTGTAVACERAVNNRLGGSCQLPVAAYAQMQDRSLHLRAMVGDPEGRRILRSESRAAPADGEVLGMAVADRLLEAGASEILASLSHAIRKGERI